MPRGDPYKGLRGAGGAFYSLWLGEEVRGLFDSLVRVLGCDGGRQRVWSILTCRGEVGFWPGKGLEAVV